jgi:HD superfamily phosphohydrolase
VRDVKVGNQRVRARRARVTVTKENVGTLEFLDLMNAIKPQSIDETEKLLLSRYIKNTDVTKDSVLRYAGVFPTRAMRNMVESGAVYDLA